MMARFCKPWRGFGVGAVTDMMSNSGATKLLLGNGTIERVDDDGGDVETAAHEHKRERRGTKRKTVKRPRTKSTKKATRKKRARKVT